MLCDVFSALTLFIGDRKYIWPVKENLKVGMFNMVVIWLQIGTS